MPIAAQDGIDDWIAPVQPGSAGEGLDDWIAPANAHSDPYPDDWMHSDDWIAPAPSPVLGAAPPAPSPQPSATGPRSSSDPLAADWSLIPANRAVAAAWQPPIFLNSPGQPLSPPAAMPSLPSIPTGGLLDALANVPATDAPRSGLLDVLANRPSPEPAALPWFQGTGITAVAGGRSPTPPLLQSSGNLSSLPQTLASGDFSSSGAGYAIEGNNSGQSSAPGNPLFIPPFSLSPGLPLLPWHS